MKFENIQPGMVLWDQRYVKRGCCRELATWTVRVLAVDSAARQAQISWNNNPPRWVPERLATKYRKNRKVA